jgi:transposase
MEQLATFAGIDISKLTLDICILEGPTKKHFRIGNDPDAIREFFTSLMVTHSSLFIGMENTGCYNYNLYQALNSLDLHYHVIPPMHLKKSLGMARGKNDKVDALRIAKFLELNIKTLSAYRPQRAVITKLQLLLTVRSQRIKIKKQLSGNREQYQYLNEESESLQPLDQALIATIDKQVLAIEQQIQSLVNNDMALSACYKLISSVQGVGKILSWNLLLKTGEFNNITEPRKLACYAGIAPFDHSSGTSIRGKSRVSQYADKGLKMLLHLAAMSAIRLEGDLRDYYQRKVAEGKNKMCVLNAVRNKIIHRIYAVLKNGKPYQKYLPNTLAMS